MSADLKRLVASRGYIKGGLTRIHNIVNLDTLSLTQLAARRDRLLETFKEYDAVNVEILLLDPADTENVGEAEDKYMQTLARLNDKIKAKSDCITPSIPKATSPMSQLKLPNINIDTFSGKYSEYTQFINIFNSMIHNNPTLDNVQRLYYLRNFIKGEPFDLIKNLPVCGDSYMSALSILKDRYDNKYQIMNDHMSQILDLAPSRSTAASLRDFASNIKQRLAALTNLDDSVKHWDILLICMLSRKLDSASARDFQMERDGNQQPDMKEFLDFIEKRALALEHVEQGQAVTKHQSSPKVAAAHASAQGAPPCIQCKSDQHKLYSCPKFKLLPAKERVDILNKGKLCHTCLNSHSGKCRYHFKCGFCKKGHNSLACMQESVAPVALLSNNEVTNTTLLPTARVCLVAKDGTRITAKALLDSGSQVSFATSELVQRLGMTPTQTNVNIVGITNVNNKIKYSIPLEIHSLTSPYKLSLNCHVVDKITCKLPQNKIDISNFIIPPGIQLADKDFNIPGDIHVLMGCDAFFQVILPLQKPANESSSAPHNGQPSIINTHFGHVVAGSILQSFAANKVVSLHCQVCTSDINESLQQFWKTEEVPELYNEKSSEAELCEEIFSNSVQLSNNQFQVDLPLKLPLHDINESLGNSFDLALNRFLNLEKKLHKNHELFMEYQKFIHDIISLGHGHYIDIDDYDFRGDPLYFLPHHPVIREENKTTRLRVVFDGSMKTNKKVSLNDMLLNGPIVQRDLFEIILLFRFGEHVFTTDIKRMFRNVVLNPQFSKLQNILWRDSPDEKIKCIRLNTVTYGLKSSSFLATRCLDELATKHQNESPLASFILKNCTYVDDVLYSNSNLNQIIEAKQQLTGLLNRGSFRTHKWASNQAEILSDVPQAEQHFDEIDLQKENNNLKTLGLNFNIKDDCFKVSCPEKYDSTSVTKREVLSYICKFYDPLGFVSPIIVTAKSFMQKLWAANIDWNTPLSDDLRNEWLTFADSLADMNSISLHRHIPTENAVTKQLIGFADASSSTAYGACLYLRTIDSSGKVEMHLLCSKSRVNPLGKKLTVPRLELNAALLLAKLWKKVSDTIQLKTKIDDTFLFTDSQIVLAWVQTEATKLNAYVANRVKVIAQQTANCNWHYVNTHDNPADYISRGVTPGELCHLSLWWHGPTFLQNSGYEFNTTTDLPETLPELKPCSTFCSDPVSLASQMKGNFFEFLDRYSDINKMTRIVAYMLRFCHNLKLKVQDKTTKLAHQPLSSAELKHALMLILKHDQNIHFHDEIHMLQTNTSVKGPLKPLHPFLDGDGMLRVGGRLHNSSLPYSRKHPVILPKGSRITELIIRCEHLRLLHAGSKLLLSSLNERYWLINGIREIKKLVHKCTICFRLKAKISTQLMGSLPKDRVTQCRPFQKVGIDFAGPIDVKQSRIRRAIIGKGYICVFVCFATKAIHLELTTDLTTATFLACFKRFVSRRGLPSDVYCDNFSSFKGARNQLAELYKLSTSQEHQSQVQQYAAQMRINFHFIPSYSPVFGGLWEAAVKSTKFHLKRTVQRTLLTYEELNTVLTQIEAVLNSRPLLPLTSNCDEYTYLTPGHFLIGSALTTYTEPDVTDIPINRLRLWNVCKNMVQSFWKVWHKHYLNILQSRPKWQSDKPNIDVGSLVLLRDQNSPPLSWPMARVTKVFPGIDNKIRAFEVKTPNGKTHIRSITKISALPLNN